MKLATQLRPTASALIAPMALILAACGQPEGSQQEQPADPAPTAAPEAAFEIVAELDQGPGNLTVTAAGETIISLHQFYGHDTRVARVVDDGRLEPFAEGAELDSVLGLQLHHGALISTSWPSP